LQRKEESTRPDHARKGEGKADRRESVTTLLDEIAPARVRKTWRTGKQGPVEGNDSEGSKIVWKGTVGNVSKFGGFMYRKELERRVVVHRKKKKTGRQSIVAGEEGGSMKKAL